MHVKCVGEKYIEVLVIKLLLESFSFSEVYILSDHLFIKFQLLVFVHVIKDTIAQLLSVVDKRFILQPVIQEKSIDLLVFVVPKKSMHLACHAET